MPNTDPQRRSRRADQLRILGVLVVIVFAGFLGTRSLGSGSPAADPTEAASRVIVGEPGGAVIEDPPSTPSPTVVPEPTEPPAPSPDPQPTVEPQPTVAPTAEAPIAVPTQAPAPVVVAATPAPAPVVVAATQAPTPVVVAAIGPADVVAAFYGAVVDGRFDAAYSHWSDRMRSTFPRRENLDERFDNTTAITFHQLYVAEVVGSSATVQANFTEAYDTGESQQFIGYWRLVQVDGRWLLDEPHY